MGFGQASSIKKKVYLVFQKDLRRAGFDTITLLLQSEKTIVFFIFWGYIEAEGLKEVYKLLEGVGIKKIKDPAQIEQKKVLTKHHQEAQHIFDTVCGDMFPSGFAALLLEKAQIKLATHHPKPKGTTNKGLL